MDQGLPSVKVYTLLYAVFQHGDTVDKKLQLFQLSAVCDLFPRRRKSGRKHWLYLHTHVDVLKLTDDICNNPLYR